MFHLDHSARSTIGWLSLACVVLTLLWLPTINQPVASDSALYIVLGESFWVDGQYYYDGHPHAKHLPGQAIFVYPFTKLFGYNIGAKVSSLVAGWLILIAAWLLMSRLFSRLVAFGVVAALVLHHSFVLMAMLASADLLYTAFLLFALVTFLRAEDREQYYIPTGILLALACLTRYNGAPFFPFLFFWAVCTRPAHRFSAWLWGGFTLGTATFLLWPLRNTFIENPISDEYAAVITERYEGFFAALIANGTYYGNPAHNILPILLLAALFGVWKQWRNQAFLVGSMCASWVLITQWPVREMRYGFVGYVLLLGFAVWAIWYIYTHLPKFRQTFLLLTLSGILVSHSLALCVYSYGVCNAWFDKTIGLLPAHLNLTSEGFYAWDIVRDHLNEVAEPNAYVLVQGPVYTTWQKGVFREDIQLVNEPSAATCPLYIITGSETVDEREVYATTVAPRTALWKQECQ